MGLKPRSGSVNESVILLVDDDPDYRMLVRDAIESLGRPIKVFECVDGCEGIRFLQQTGAEGGSPRPNLVLLDLEMPGADGHEVLTRLRADERFRDLPVVVMTGLDNDESERRAMENGASSYTCKVQNVGDMLGRIEAAAIYWTTVHRQLKETSSAA